MVLVMKVTGDNYEVIAGEDECLRTRGDIRKWQEEHNFRGVVIPMRYAMHDADGKPAGVARREITVTEEEAVTL